MLTRRMGLNLLSHGIYRAKGDTSVRWNFALRFFLYQRLRGQIAHPAQLPASDVLVAELFFTGPSPHAWGIRKISSRSKMTLF